MTSITNSASKAISTSLESTQDPSIRKGLQDALILINYTIPDLHASLSNAIHDLEDASTVVDAGEDEEYAYQRTLEEGREALLRYENNDYSSRDT